jgi:pseudouridine-5'-phosphate glycosidase/pseudouridine kinase
VLANDVTKHYNFSEPTSIIKSTAILPAIALSLEAMDSNCAPIAFASPNIRELVQLDQASRTEPFDLTSHSIWWSVIDNFSLGSTFRMDLERLARMNTSNFDSSKGTLEFLVNQGVAQMAVKLLPFFQHLVIKCGEQGVIVAMRISQADSLTSPWAQKRSDPSERYVIARGTNGETIVLQHFPALSINNVINVTGAGDSFVGALLAKLVQNPKLCQNPKSLHSAIFSAQRAAVLSLQSSCAVSPSLSLPDQSEPTF